LHLSSENSVSKLAFQIRLAPLHRVGEAIAFGRWGDHCPITPSPKTARGGETPGDPLNPKNSCPRRYLAELNRTHPGQKLDFGLTTHQNPVNNPKTAGIDDDAWYKYSVPLRDHGGAVQVELCWLTHRLKTTGFKPLPLNINPGFKTCLSNSTCATTPRQLQVPRQRGWCRYLGGAVHVETMQLTHSLKRLVSTILPIYE
jgi:hypothetical protein